ncbi:CASP-like protein 4D1 [Apium graveolens]|uniref:CASP-like protein 4D1 n=1 Tax=Apium graveolens TaxID=4045 RepID=UPI003D7B7E27
MAILSKASAKTSLGLRILSLLLLVASVIVMVTCSIPDFIDDSNDRFTILFTYRYVFAIGIVGCLYSLVQIIFGGYHVYTHNRCIRNGCLPIFDLYGNMLISFLLATATGAGFAVTYEINKYFDIVVELGGSRNFLNQLFVSVGFLFTGFICMAILSVVSSIFRESGGSGEIT